MAFTYTDSDKIVLEAWGKFKVTLLEAVEPGDLLSFINGATGGATYAVQFADESDSQRADCIAVDGGAAGDTITACLKAVCSTIPTITAGNRGDPTAVYFAASTDYLGAPLYLGEAGKPESDEGSTYVQGVGRLLARDRILLDVSSRDAPHFSGAAKFDGAVIMASTLAVTGAVTLSSTLTVAGVTQIAGITIITAALYLGAGMTCTGLAAFNSGIGVAGGINITGMCLCNGGISVAGTTDLQIVTVHSSLAVAAGGTLGFPQKTSATQLPSADPGVAGELWCNSNVVTRSTGT